MEKAIGIVCEFNPFHNGHAYLLQELRRREPQKPLVCVMSGNFVQRGSLAVADKYSRARCALLSGADLVLELPFPFSCLSAEAFSSSAVSLLSAIGVCDTLAFGSELPEVSIIEQCAENLSTHAFQHALEKFASEKKGVGFPRARESVYESLFGPCPVFSYPNASLAVSYAVANRKLSHPFGLLAVHRAGEHGKTDDPAAPISSATACRAAIEAGDADALASLCPAACLDVLSQEHREGRFPVSTEALAPVLFYLLRTKSRKELGEIYGFSALCDRAVRMMDGCRSIRELTEKMRTATFTDSRIRRALLALVLAIPRHAEKKSPAYTLVLGAGERGRELLAVIRKSSSIPVYAKPVHALKSEDLAVRRQASAAVLSDRIYVSAFPKAHEEAYFLKQMPYLL